MTDDEHYWYRLTWRSYLYPRIVRVAIAEMDRLLRYCALANGGDAEKAALAEEYVDAVMKELDRRRQENARERGGDGGPWAWALRLFDRPRDWSNALVKDQNAICDRQYGVTPRQALTTTVRAWTNQARARMLAPDDPNRLRVWNAIQGIAKAVESKHGVPDHPLDRQYRLLVLAAILVKVQAGDNNLPRTLKTLTGYFYEFDTRCQALSITIDDESEPDEPDLSAEQVDALMRFTTFRPQLHEALLTMPLDLRPCFQHWFAGLGGLAREAEVEFCSRAGLSVAEYRRRVERGKKHLRDALEDMI